MNKLNYINQRIIAGLISLCTLACLPPPPIPKLVDNTQVSFTNHDEATEADEVAAAELFQEIKQLAGTDAAIKKEAELLKKYPTTATASDIFWSRARKAQQAGHNAEALEYYARILFYRPQYENTTAVRIEYGRLSLQLGHSEEAVKTFQFLYANAELPEEIDKLAMLFADSLISHGHEDQALELLVERRRSQGISPAQRNRTEQRAKKIVTEDLNFAQTKRLWAQYGTSSHWEFVQPILAFRLAKVFYHVRDYEQSKSLLQQIAKRFPSSQWSSQANNFIERIRNRFEVAPKTIGVVLPLSGRYKKYGERSLTAIKLAFAQSPNLKIEAKDSQGDPTIAAEQVESLVIEHHAIAIIGPLFSKASFSAALKAEELSIPMLVLSHRNGIPEIGPYIFRTGLTVKSQAQALAKTAFETLGMSKFAVLYPKSPYGIEFTNAFWDEVNKRQGEIRGIESYEHNQTTFSEQVRKLVGRHYYNSRYDYHVRKNEIFAKHKKPFARMTQLKNMLKTLPPIVDFDAIVIPDRGKNIGLVAPAIAVEDVILTTDPKALQTARKTTGNDKIHPVTLLGASTWNSPRILRSCERYCENAVFVDGYYTDNPHPKVRNFVESFKEKTGATPNLFDAIAYDTAGMLHWVLTGKKPNTREELQKYLLEAAYFNGVTGKWRFTENGEADKNLFTLTIADNSIQLYKSPSQTSPEQ